MIDELKNQLKAIAGDNISDETMYAIKNLMEDYGVISERAARVEQLENDLGQWDAKAVLIKKFMES